MTSWDWNALRAEEQRQREERVNKRIDARTKQDGEFVFLVTTLQENLEALLRHPTLQRPMMPLTPQWKAAIDAGAEARAQAFAAREFRHEADRAEALRRALALVRSHLDWPPVEID